MPELKTRSDIELFGYELRTKIYDPPSNLLFLVIVPEEDFHKLHMEITGQHADTDRIIYNSSSGVEFGIKTSQL